MIKQLTIKKIEQPYTKHILEIGVADDKFDANVLTPIFSKACTIVDAQFYYTNPLMFVLSTPEQCKEFALLYDNYYLIPPRFYDTIDINLNCLAVNYRFVQDVCSLALLAESEPQLKHSQKELDNPQETPPNRLNSLFDLYQQKGLYVIGICQD